MIKDFSPQYEAKALLPLLENGHSIENIKSLIAVTPEQAKEIRQRESHAEDILRFRAHVLDYFEVYAGVKPAPELAAPCGFRQTVKTRKHPPIFDRAAIVEALHKGERTGDIARRMGCSYQHVGKIARMNGIKLKIGGWKGKVKHARAQTSIC